MPNIDVVIKRRLGVYQDWEASFVDESNGKWSVTGRTYYEALGKLVDSYRNVLSIAIHKES